MNAIDFAHSILDMEEELARLRNENKKLRWFEEEYQRCFVASKLGDEIEIPKELE